MWSRRTRCPCAPAASGQRSPTARFRRAVGAASVILLATLLRAEAGPATAQQAAEAFRLAIHDDRVTLQAENVALAEILEALAQRAAFELIARSSLQQRLTMRLEGVRLPEAIDRVLHGESYLMQYSPGARPVRPSKLWVFSSGAAAGTDAPGRTGPPAPPSRVPVPHTRTTPRDLGPALTSMVAEDPLKRAEAVYTVAEIMGETSVAGGDQALQAALQDPDERVREAAIEAWADVGGEAAIHSLALALYDAEPALREEALYALAEIGGDTVLDLLSQARSDPDALVRQAAEDLLAEQRAP